MMFVLRDLDIHVWMSIYAYPNNDIHIDTVTYIETDSYFDIDMYKNTDTFIERVLY